MSAWIILAQAGAELVPPRGEFGLPGPLWFLHMLVPLTFALHAVFMNFALGAAFIVPVFWGVGRRREPALLDAARRLVRAWPIAVSFTITSGVAALLFVQVLYGHMFYTANILIGWRWLAILGYLLIGFYLIYALDRLIVRDRFGAGMGVIVLIALAFLLVGHEFNNNSVLMLMPELWRGIHDGELRRHAPHAMWNPRMFHSIIGAVAVTGVWVAVLARGWRPYAEDARRIAVRYGLRTALVATVLQVVSGLWFYVSLDPDVQRSMFAFSDLRAVLWMLAVLGGFGLLFLFWRGSEAPDDARWVVASAGVTAFVLVGMSAGREVVRLRMLARYPGALFTSTDVRVQSGPMLAFVVALAIGLAVVALMLYWMRTAPAAPSTLGPSRD